MATKTIVKLIQHAHFSKEIEELKNNRNVSLKGKMNKLNPFIDDDGIVRVGGRLTNATDIDTDQRFPIILPYETTFLKLIMLHEHKKLMHAGPHATLASVRMKYWPINGRRCNTSMRNMFQSTTKKCVAYYGQFAHAPSRPSK